MAAAVKYRVGTVRASTTIEAARAVNRRSIMRGLTFLIIAVLAVALCIWAGWVAFSTSGDQATITIDGQEIKEDTREAIDKTEQSLESAKDAWDRESTGDKQ
jgi:predicted PurR-regulated permease PerM